MDRKALRKMKRTAYLINTARGSIIDEKALVGALREKWIAGAGLDVYEDEPKVQSGLRKLNNVILLPHIGSASRETRVRMGMRVLENLSAFFSGRIPPNRVN